MRLNILLPTRVPKLVGKYKNRIDYGESDVLLETTVYRIKRIPRNGKYDAEQIVAYAFIPPQYRNGIDATDWRWQDAETLQVLVNIEDNRNSLRAFVDSHDAEWDVREKS